MVVTKQLKSTLQTLFGEIRAEWAYGSFGELFVEPTYHAKLQQMRPSILVGGRGTGKTTSLQSLHYLTTRPLDPNKSGGEPTFFGVLVRMNKNRVRAFEGSALQPNEWNKLFTHYFNLLVCEELAGLTNWLQERSPDSLALSSLRLIARDLGLATPQSVQELQQAIREAVSDLQLYVNNPFGGDPFPKCSMAEAPLRTFVTELRDSGLLGPGIVFCCIDEFENLIEYQQSIINTYIKHAEPPLSYKIGVRKNGIKTRRTLDGSDLLREPDDYSEIEIADEGFELFARQVAEVRLDSAVRNGLNVPTRLSAFLEELTLEQEADLLGAGKIAAEVRTQLRELSPALESFAAAKSNLELSFLRYWQENDDRSLPELAYEWISDERAWDIRFGNYAFASLFALSRGNKGARIRKYYCGERVFLSLAAGNIRYFLELIEVAVGNQLLASKGSIDGSLTLSPQSQTYAARDVGERRLGQLEGLAEHGVALKRLVLAIGKVFFEFARSPSGRTPEVNSFVVTGISSPSWRGIAQLLSEGVGHLAFEVEPRTKATSNVEVKDDEYRLHRIFSAFFEISHRKKRRTTFKSDDLQAVLGDRPSRAISALLGNKIQTDQESLPEQMAFFSAFYEGMDANDSTTDQH